ncbi:MAG: hypothetical protein P4L22_07110 [Candidatus Babeliales bacterium]|nr:hypothetical protein [Candidatus Babeliales bacterium]
MKKFILLFTMLFSANSALSTTNKVTSSVSQKRVERFLQNSGINKSDISASEKTEKLLPFALVTTKTINHVLPIYAVEISNDNKLVISDSFGTAQIIDLFTGKLLNTAYHNYNGKCYSVAISNDNKFIVNGGCKTVKITDIITGKLLYNINNQYVVYSVAISNDNRFVVTGSDTAKIIDLRPEVDLNQLQIKLINYIYTQKINNNDLLIKLNKEQTDIFLTLSDEIQDSLGENYQLQSDSFKPTVSKLIKSKSNFIFDNIGLIASTQSKQHLKLHHKNEFIKRVLQNKANKDFFLSIYAQEKIEHDNGNYTFVHGREWKWNFLSDIYKQLWNIMRNDNVNGNYQFLRFGIPGYKRRDNSDILFMNSAIFGNSTNSGSCTANYWNDNYDQSSNKSVFWGIQEIFQSFNLINLWAKYEPILKNLQVLHQQCSQRGEILLVSIPENKLDNVICTQSSGGIKEIRVNGVPTSDPKTILETIKNNPQNVENLDRLEWGLKLGKFDNAGNYNLNPYTNDPHNGPAIYSFHMGDEEKLQEYQNLRDQIFANIKADIESGNTQLRSRL